MLLLSWKKGKIHLCVISEYTISPRQEAALLIFKRGSWNGIISHGFYSKMFFQMKGLGGLYMKYSIFLSILIYKPRLLNKYESGLSSEFFSKQI